MRIKLIRYTPRPDELCSMAASLCTGYTGDVRNALNGAMNRGHLSVTEHACFTFLIEEISTSALAQLTRHRIASYSVQSERYCGADKPIVCPDSILNNPAASGVFAKAVWGVQQAYQDLVHNYDIPEEDARMVMPKGTTYNLMMTMNARELLQFFELRCCNRAQWEIRRMAWQMLSQVKEVAPLLFRKAGPPCLYGTCPEGKATCGNPYRKEEEAHERD